MFFPFFFRMIQRLQHWIMGGCQCTPLKYVNTWGIAEHLSCLASYNILEYVYVHAYLSNRNVLVHNVCQIVLVVQPHSLLYIKVILCVTWIVGQSPWRHSLPLLHSYCTWTWTSPSFTSSDRLWCPYCVVSVPSRLVRLASLESGLFRLCFVSFVLWEYYGLACVWAFCHSVINLSLACVSPFWLF